METINLTLEPDQDIYFTSDMHYGHRRIIQFCQRPFQDIKEMGEALTAHWNERVRPQDIIFNLGDTIWFDGRHDTKRVVSKLNGHKHFLLGNHCSVQQYELCDKDLVTIHQDITRLRLQGRKGDPRFANQSLYEIVLCHYPLLCYSHSQAGAYMLFGHIHSRPGQPMMEFGHPLIFPHQRYMDVGTDRHHYYPVSWWEVMKEIQEYPFWEMHKLPGGTDNSIH